VNQEIQDVQRWDDAAVEPGGFTEVAITVSESYSGMDVQIPLYVWKGEREGPSVFVTAAVHGDEINGAGAIRHLIWEQPFSLEAGTLVLVPVVNLMGFERHSRYLPDRRDLNRSFPGSADGSLAARLAHSVYQGVISRCDYGIDLHTAAVRRTNFPNVRADMSDPAVADLARAFGAEIIVAGRGPKGSLRRTACRAGIPTIILEAGEVWKVEPSYIEYAAGGVRNCLARLGMVKGRPRRPPFSLVIDKTEWVRAHSGGFLIFHVAPGDSVAAGDPIATNTSLTGRELNVIESPRDGVVLGMTTIPSVAPGDPICHLAYTKSRSVFDHMAEQESSPTDSLYQRTREGLSSNIHVSDAETD